MFSGLNFSYDGLSSTDYGIQILDFDGVGKFSNNILATTLTANKPAPSIRFFKSGSNVDTPPQFKLSVVSQTALNDSNRRAILRWLYNRSDFKQFRVSQSDLANYYYMCIFTNVDAIYINGKCYGFELTGQLNSPYQYGESTLQTGTTGNNRMATINVINNSDIPDGYVYPKIIINKPATNSITTVAVGTMSFDFTAAAEILTVDCELKSINSNIRTYPMTSYSGAWLKIYCNQNAHKETEVPIAAVEGTKVTIECPTYVLVGY